MKIEFTGRHIEVTPALRSHVEEHFARIEHLFDGRPPKPHVIIEVERGRHRSEIVMNWRNEVLTANSSNADMYKSLAQTVSKIEKQARRLKDKVIDKSHRAKKAAVVAAPPEPVENHGPQVVKSNGFGKKPMTTEEALLALEASEYPFYVFRTSNGGNVNVVFKRKDGHFGLIEP